MANIKPYEGEQPYIFISYAHAIRLTLWKSYRN